MKYKIGDWVKWRNYSDNICIAQIEKINNMRYHYTVYLDSGSFKIYSWDCSIEIFDEVPGGPISFEEANQMLKKHKLEQL